MEASSVEDVLAMRERLVAAGVQVTGLVDHDFIKSIYFFDPNGLRLEVTARTEAPGYRAEAAREARPAFEAWTKAKAEKLAAKAR
jgi:hypothetical protein